MTLSEFFAGNQKVIRALIADARGSSPREAGAAIYVSQHGSCGTIGGGQLEFMVLDHARQMLAGGKHHSVMNVPLGPEIGQCCGGRVTVTLERMDERAKSVALRADEVTQAALPQVLVFGAGHVGRALVRALAPLPLRVRLIDNRAEQMALAACPDKCLTALPESEVARAEPGAAFVTVTHDHALDFLIVAEALARTDAAYVGMIGSQTKRAKFIGWARPSGVETAALVCPMGRAGLGDKRPEVIAAHIASEILVALSKQATAHTEMEAGP